MTSLQASCTLLELKIESVGPVTLQLEIKGHYRSMHPDVDALSEKFARKPGVPHSWTCPKYGCPAPNVSRADDELLTLAITGHDRHYHPAAEVVSASYVQDKNSVWIPLRQETPYDRQMLSGMKIIW